jgi:hypothetical protein
LKLLIVTESIPSGAKTDGEIKNLLFSTEKMYNVKITTDSHVVEALVYASVS